MSRNQASPLFWTPKFHKNYSFSKWKMWNFSYSFRIMAIFYFIEGLFKGGKYLQKYSSWVFRTVPHVGILHNMIPKICVMRGPSVKKNELEKNYFKNAASKIILLHCAFCSHLSKHTARVIKNLNLIFLKTSGPNPGRQLMAYLIILKYIWTCKQVILSNFQIINLVPD